VLGAEGGQPVVEDLGAFRDLPARIQARLEAGGFELGSPLGRVDG